MCGDARGAEEADAGVGVRVMGYFSNGSEGADYEDRWCSTCAHNREDGCPVWMAHLLHNGEKPFMDVLDLLIPRSEDGFNERCTMYVWNPK